MIADLEKNYSAVDQSVEKCNDALALADAAEQLQGFIQTPPLKPLSGEKGALADKVVLHHWSARRRVALAELRAQSSDGTADRESIWERLKRDEAQPDVSAAATEKVLSPHKKLNERVTSTLNSAKKTVEKNSTKDVQTHLDNLSELIDTMDWKTGLTSTTTNTQLLNAGKSKLLPKEKTGTGNNFKRKSDRLKRLQTKLTDQAATLEQLADRWGFTVQADLMDKVNKKTVLAKTLRSEAKLVQHLTTNYKDGEGQKRDIRTEIGVINAEGVVGVNKPLMQLAEAALQPKQTQPKS